MQPSDEAIKQTNLTKIRELDYQDVLMHLKNTLSNMSAQDQEIALQAKKTIEQIEKLKTEGAVPVAELTKSLRATHALLRSKMSPEQYQSYAKEVEESSSLGMKILGGLMLGLALLISAMAVVLIGEGTLLSISAAVVGLECSVDMASYSLRFFNKQNPSPSANCNPEPNLNFQSS